MKGKTDQTGDVSFNVQPGWHPFTVHKFGYHDKNGWVNPEIQKRVTITMEPYSARDWLVFWGRKLKPLAYIVLSYFVNKMLDCLVHLAVRCKAQLMMLVSTLIAKVSSVFLQNKLLDSE